MSHKTPPPFFFAIESVVILVSAIILQTVGIVLAQFAAGANKLEVDGAPATEEHRIYCGLLAAICFICSMYVISVKATEDERRRQS